MDQVQKCASLRIRIKYNIFQGEAEISIFQGGVRFWLDLTDQTFVTDQTMWKSVSVVHKGELSKARTTQIDSSPGKNKISLSPWNRLYLSPVRKQQRLCTWFIGSQLLFNHHILVWVFYLEDMSTKLCTCIIESVSQKKRWFDKLLGPLNQVQKCYSLRTELNRNTIQTRSYNFHFQGRRLQFSTVTFRDNPD